MYLGNIGSTRVYGYRKCIPTMHFGNRIIVWIGSADFRYYRRLIDSYVES